LPQQWSVTKKGKTNAKKNDTRSAGKNRTRERKQSGAKKPRDMGGKPQTSARASAGTGNHRRRRAATFTLKPKRTFQVTDEEAEERLQFKAGKGKKPISSSSTAREVLLAGAKRATKKFSRKKSGRYVARIRLKWKSKSGKWVSRNLVQVSDSLQEAIDKLLEHDEINSLTYETFSHDDGDLVSGESSIASKTKRIAGVSFSKYTKRKYKSGKISKTAKSKARPKKSRNVRRRK
jgi:hypothetical protein